MMDIKRAWTWLCRCRYSRGFGVQSPWAYRFVRYVINEHYPYYAYDELDTSSNGLSARQRRLFRLYFRLANYVQPQVILNIGTITPACEAYLQHGCKHAVIRTVDMAEEIVHQPFELVRLTCDADNRVFYETLVPHTDERTLLVIEGINDNKKARQFWKEVVADERATATFDLYDCGIVFFDCKRIKKHYIINF